VTICSPPCRRWRPGVFASRPVCRPAD
jgi:hypothetical protein